MFWGKMIEKVFSVDLYVFSFIALDFSTLCNACSALTISRVVKKCGIHSFLPHVITGYNFF